MYDLNLLQPGNVQISSSGIAYCTTPGWSDSKKTVDVIVNCYDLDGNPADSAFTFLYQSRSKTFGTPEKGIAFLWADQPTEASYTPNPEYQFNSTGATNAMIRNGTGSYTASIPGLTKRGGNVQVTAYGDGPARCKVSSWSADQSGTHVNVLCFDDTGASADEMFTMAYTIGEPLGLFDYKQNLYDGDIGAYVWADKPDRSKIYVPPHSYNYNGFKTGGLTVQKKATGYYMMSLSGVVAFGQAAALVTASGDSNTFCIVADGPNWMPTDIYCYDQNGHPTDSKFSVLLQTDVRK
jgi:hypothetical protein